MTTITFDQVKENNIAAVSKQVFEYLKSFLEELGATHQPVFLDPQILWDMGVTPEEVEFKLRQPAWRDIGRYL